MFLKILSLACICLAVFHLARRVRDYFIFRQRLRRACITVSNHLSATGWVVMPRLLNYVATGGYVELVAELEKQVVLIEHDPTAAIEEFDEAFKRMLDATLATPSGRDMVSALLAKAAPAVTLAPVAKAA